MNGEFYGKESSQKEVTSAASQGLVWRAILSNISISDLVMRTKWVQL